MYNLYYLLLQSKNKKGLRTEDRFDGSGSSTVVISQQSGQPAAYVSVTYAYRYCIAQRLQFAHAVLSNLVLVEETYTVNLSYFWASSSKYSVTDLRTKTAMLTAWNLLLITRLCTNWSTTRRPTQSSVPNGGRSRYQGWWSLSLHLLRNYRTHKKSPH